MKKEEVKEITNWWRKETAAAEPRPSKNHSGMTKFSERIVGAAARDWQ
jgi:hypothetical protein